MRGPRLTRTVATKLSPADYERMVEIAAAAGYRTHSDWLRDAAVAALGGSTSARADVLLEELISLRSVIFNLLFRLLNGQAITKEQMAALVEQSDAKKSDLARARLSA